MVRIVERRVGYCYLYYMQIQRKINTIFELFTFWLAYQFAGANCQIARICEGVRQQQQEPAGWQALVVRKERVIRPCG